MTGEVAHGSARGEVVARILDLSMGGALLVVHAPLEVGAIHDFALQLGGITVWVQGEVRRATPAPRGGGYEIGVEFLGIDPQDERVLRAYVDQQGR
jgi:c-di-GMP-binding flagellar brake protein YcgR